MVAQLNFAPSAAASHTSSNSSARDFARMIASLVALSAANMRESRSFCASALAFSLARSKLSSATDTFSAIRAISAMTSSSVLHSFPTKKIKTPMILPSLVSGTATQAMTPASSPTLCHRPNVIGMSLLMQGRWVRNAWPQIPVP